MNADNTNSGPTNSGTIKPGTINSDGSNSKTHGSQQPLVSVITPVYNAEAYLAHTIQSVIDQTYQNFEMLLIFDRNSSDQSQAIAEHFAINDARLRVRTGPPEGGVSANRNLGLEQATGQYVAFLDADDLWLPEKLQVQVDQMQIHDWPFSYHSYEWIDASGEPLGVERRANKIIAAKDLMPLNWLGCLSVMVDRTALGANRFLNIQNEDWILWQQILKQGFKAYPIEKTLGKYRILPNSRSANKFHIAKSRWQTYRRYFGLSMGAAIKNFALYAFYSVIIRLKII